MNTPSYSDKSELHFVSTPRRGIADFKFGLYVVRERFLFYYTMVWANVNSFRAGAETVEGVSSSKSTPSFVPNMFYNIFFACKASRKALRNGTENVPLAIAVFVCEF